MAANSIVGTFPVTNGIVMSAGATDATGYGPGAELVIPETDQPSLTESWKISGVAFTFVGYIAISGPTTGLPGAIYGGLIPRSVSLSKAFMYGDLPGDSSLFDLIWDPVNDPPFPLSSGGSTPHQAVFHGEVSLQNPSVLHPGEQLSVGLWMLPALASPIADGFTMMQVITACTYSILYDDGS
jgi:hypothetical protein